MDGQWMPTTVAEAEPVLSKLILGLYNPRASHDSIADIQRTLQQLQKQPEGWQMAQTLLERPLTSKEDDQIRFFGALTVVIKLNTESSNLSETDARELLQNLVRWLIASASSECGQLSAQKLCHALVTFFIHFSQLWPHCIRHLLWSLRTGDAQPVDAVADQGPSVEELTVGMDWRLLRAALWFVNTLVTDVGKTDMRAPKYHALYGNLLKVAPDVATLLHVGIMTSEKQQQQSQPQPPSQQQQQQQIFNIQRESIKGLQSWILHAQRLPIGSEVVVEPLRNLVVPTLQCLQYEELYDVAIELLMDTLSNYPEFFTDAHYDAIASLFVSDWGENHLRQLLQGDFDFEPLQYGLLLLAYGDARVNKLLTSVDARDRRILDGLCSLLAASGYPVAEDVVFVPALEFWATFLETMLDIVFAGDESDWAKADLALIDRAVAHCWRKIQYPSIETFMAWDRSDRTGFGDARKDVADLLQAVFALNDRDVLRVFGDLLQQSIQRRNWAEVEATAFCLASLADCFVDDNKYDAFLAEAVFSSPLFDLLALGESQLPMRLRQTAMTLIEHYAEYFERNPTHLPAALNLLFEAVTVPSLAHAASRSIATICSSCRSLLTQEVGAFLSQYNLLHDRADLDPLAEERVVHAIAAILQATPDATVRLSLFEQLLSFVVRDVELVLRYHHSSGSMAVDPSQPVIAKALRAVKQDREDQEAHHSNQDQSQPPKQISTDEVLLQAALTSLRCLGNIAKGMQAVTDPEVVDVDGTTSSSSSAAPAPSLPADVYAAHLEPLQRSIMDMLQAIQQAFTRSSEVVDGIGIVLRAGFSETEPGPFVFPPEAVTAFFTQRAPRSPYIGSIVNIACSFVSSLTKPPYSASSITKSSTSPSLQALVSWVIGLLQALPEQDIDPELTQHGIELVGLVLQKRPAVVLHLQPPALLEFFFLFTIKVLSGREPLPKAAAASFWSSFVSLKPDPADQPMVDAAMNHLGPLLSESLMYNFGGKASRSELDQLCDPLKKLVTRNVHAKAWLEQALMAPSFPSYRVTAEAKAIFLKKLISLRGNRNTNAVVRDFWLESVGGQFAYAS